MNKLHEESIMFNQQSVEISKLDSLLDFTLDEDSKTLLSEIGYVQKSKTSFIYGYGNVPVENDIYQMYLYYKDNLRFYPSNSLPVIKLNRSSLIVYDCVQRKCMIIDIADQGEIKYTFDGGLLEVVKEYLKT